MEVSVEWVSVTVMPYDIQIVVDSADPHTQADWWAETLDWGVEPSNEELIRKLVAAGEAQEDDTKLHNGVLVWRTGQAIRHPDGRRILFNQVPESKSVKNRMHIDIRVGDENRAAVVAQLTERGATTLWEMQEGPYSWVTMADPEGNEFCVT
jgi:hypothetical protein